MSRSDIDVVLKRLLPGGGTSPTMVSLFSEDGDNYHKIKIENGDKYDTEIGYIALGMSVRLVSRTFKIFTNLGHIGGFHNIIDGLVQQFVQTAISINLEHISHLICDKRC